MLARGCFFDRLSRNVLILVGLTAAAPSLALAQAGGGVPVTVSKPSYQDVPVYLKGLGLVAASNTVVLHPRVDGTLDRVLFNEGDEVKAGALLAVIDPRPYQAVLDQVVAKKASDEASLTNARQSLGRSTQLARNQFETQATVDNNVASVAQLTAAIKGDEANIAAARLNLEFTQITAPFDGRVGLRLTDPGSFIHAADNTSPGIATLSAIHPVTVTFTLPQDRLGQIITAMSKGKPSVLTSTADDKTQLSTGKMLTIDNTIDTTTGTIKVKAIFDNTDSKLWPGQFLNARMLVDVRQHALTVPTSAILRGQLGMYVYTIQPDQTAKSVPVEVVQDTGNIAVVSSGLTGTETVVVAGQSRLANGSKVQATNAPGS